MAQHDYVIANGTGAAVRSDLNNALAAIVSQNSGATAPATTYAYQFWADTTTGLLKLRNAANSAWITLFQLDGEWSTLAVENGTAAAPSIYFKDSGTDTGFYSPGADQVAISTNGSGRLFVDSSGRVGVGVSSPSRQFQVNNASGSAFASVVSANASADVGYLFGTTSSDALGQIIYDNSTNSLRIATNSSERVRITSAGLVGIGTTNSVGKLTVATSSADPSTALSAWSDGYFVVTPGGTTTSGGIGLSFNTSTNIGGISCAAPGSAWRDLIYKASAHRFELGGSEAARIDSSGRLLVGTSTSRSWSGISSQFQIENVGASTYTSQSIIANSADAVGGLLVLGKSRGTSLGSNTAVQNNDLLGRIYFYGADGSGLVQGATIEALVDGTPGTNDMPGRLVFSTTADGASSPTERMRINASGGFKASTNGTYQAASSASHEFYQSGDADILRLRAVSGSYANTGIDINIDRNTTNGTYYFYRANCTGVATRFQVLDSGNVQNANNSYTGISDSKLKENIVDAGSQWNDIKEIRVRNYNFKEETGQPTHRQIGLIAQELETVCPNLVDALNDRDAEGNNLGTTTKSVNYSVLYMKAVKALQEAMERIEQLEAEMAEVKAQLS